ncbi:BMP family ABC transporter substrate-binding protein [Mycoplasma bradburyae]|uniref:BMP family ABC transporter substrate-binding protein n=1 Tax=Mycoplasma bradburyae TaxID=2963128 RepID=UPI0023426068|nr:BMP family ABC transporter substrate-binding protein [Mycoplasma bradburyae]MDC4183785.1 BMP family ABC transporter substrate-binding protein [Mycoplasma bradburyae]
MKNKTKVKKITTALGIAGAASIAGATLASCGASLSYKSSVQLVVSNDSSTLADQSFSESSFNGIRDFYKKELMIDIPQANSSSISVNDGLWKRPGDTDDKRINTYRQIKNEGSLVAVATGFNQESALNKILDNTAYYNEFKDFGFIFVDGVISKTNGTNISAITFQTESAAFLTGIAAGVLVNKNTQFFKPVMVGNVSTYGIGSFVGLALPSTVSFLNGFRLGAIFFNEYIQPKVKGFKKLSWISSNKTQNDGARDSLAADVSGSFSNTEQKATTITDGLLDNGASLVYPVAGPQTALSQSAILSKKEQHKAQLIGVDTAQENLATTQALQGAPGGKTIAFSTVKALDVAVYSTLKAIKDGTPYKGFYGYGWNNLASLANHGVSLSNAGLAYLPDLADLFEKTKSTAEADAGASVSTGANGSNAGMMGMTEMTTTSRASTLRADPAAAGEAGTGAGAATMSGNSENSAEATTTATTSNEPKQIESSALVTVTDTNKQSILDQYVKILAGTFTLFSSESDKTRWVIKGNELTTFKTKIDADAKLLPVLTIEGNNKALSHASALLASSKKQATGELLNQSKKTFVFSKLR